jgi:FAD dependent oxidoreductase TIGR03364
MAGEWFTHGVKTLETYKKIQSDFDITLREQGSIYLASTGEEMKILEEMVIIFNGKEYPCSILSKQEVLTQYPNVKSDYVLGGLYFPEECNVEPLKLISKVQSFINETFSNFYFHSYHTATWIEENSEGVKVNCSNGKTFLANQLIVTTGYEYSILFPDLYKKSDLLYCKLNMMATKQFTDVTLKSNILTGMTIRRYASFKEAPSFGNLKTNDFNPLLKEFGIHLLFKQGIDGSIIIGDSHEYTDSDTPSKLTFRIDSEINDLIIEEAKRIIALPYWEMRYHWAGTYSQHKSEEIFNKKISNNIRIVTGIGGKGMTTGCGYSYKNIEDNY